MQSQEVGYGTSRSRTCAIWVDGFAMGCWRFRHDFSNREGGRGRDNGGRDNLGGGGDNGDYSDGDNN